jgi:AcrR family transcriptional regulator
MKVFWLKGYDATTIDDLVEGMGVQRPSLYAIFGDKTTLFMRCLEEYVARGACAMQTQLCQPDIRQVISGILKSAVENATREGEHLGCMLASVAPLVDNDVIRDYIAQKGKESSAAVERRFQVGIDAGELPKNFPAAQRARQTLDIAAADYLIDTRHNHADSLLSVEELQDPVELSKMTGRQPSN